MAKVISYKRAAQKGEKKRTLLHKLRLSLMRRDLLYILRQRHDEVHLPKVVVHFLQRSASGFREEEVEGDGVGKGTDAENQVISPAYRDS